MSTPWITMGQPVAEQLTAGRVFLTYRAYVAFCAGEEATQPLTHWPCQRAMLRRGLMLAPEDELADPFDRFVMICYPTARAPQRRREKLADGRA